MRFHPFTRLNKLLESVQAGGGNTPLALSVGEPQFTPPEMVQRLISEQFPLWGKYPQALGNEPFRKAAAGWLTRRFRLPEGMVDPAKHVMPVSGTREALFHIALSAVPEIAPGEDKPVVLMPNPFYHVYAGAAAAAGAEPYFLNATEENGFFPEIAAIPRRDPEAHRARLHLLARQPAGRGGAAVIPHRLAEAGARAQLRAGERRVLFGDLSRHAAARRARSGARSGRSRSTTSSSSIRSASARAARACAPASSRARRG